MNEAGNPAQECPDQGVRYILLAIEAEILSEQSVSPYLREASHRLSQFWLARAAAARNDENMPQEFHAPTRNSMSRDNYNRKSAALDNTGEDIGGAHAGILIDVEMGDGAELPLTEDRNKHAGFFGAHRD